jgi:hypothetical protein
MDGRDGRAARGPDSSSFSQVQRAKTRAERGSNRLPAAPVAAAWQSGFAGRFSGLGVFLGLALGGFLGAALRLLGMLGGLGAFALHAVLRVIRFFRRHGLLLSFGRKKAAKIFVLAALDSRI